MKRVTLLILILMFTALAVCGCSTSNSPGTSVTSYEPGKLLGTAGQGTDRVSDVPVSPGATINPLLSPASTF